MALYEATPLSYPSAVFMWEGVELHTAQTPCLDSLKRGWWELATDSSLGLCLPKRLAVLSGALHSS